jgi:hypothetical protein
MVEAKVEAPVTVDAIDVVSVASMLDRLETAVADREARLAKLEALAKAEITKPVVEPKLVEPVEAEILPPTPRAALLEAVPTVPKPQKTDEMDAALRSALETLHRMNARTR